MLGLASFALQCVFVTFARGVSDIFFSLLFSCLANLVYPAVSSLVSRYHLPPPTPTALGRSSSSSSPVPVPLSRVLAGACLLLSWARLWGR